MVPDPANNSHDRGLQIMNLLRQNGMNYPCSASPITLYNEYSFIAMVSMNKTFRKDEDQLKAKVIAVKRSLQAFVSDLSNRIPVEDQSKVPEDIINYLPFLFAADKEIARVVRDYDTFNKDGTYIADPWDKLSHVRLSIFPSFSGINPIKMSDRYAGSRATYLRNILRA
jgi:hypothetical protein